jgi:hypothetical protein
MWEEVWVQVPSIIAHDANLELFIICGREGSYLGYVTIYIIKRDSKTE